MKGEVKDNYVIRETWAKSSAIPDMNIWDVSSPDQPVPIDEPSLGEYRVSYNIAGNTLVLKNRENFHIELYDISNLPEIEYLSHIDYYNSEYDLMSGSINIFDDDLNSLYLKKPPGIFTCYNISNPEEPEFLFEIIEEDYLIMNKQDDYIYFYESYNGDEGDLKIYSGITSNNPQLAAHYPNFFPDNYCAEILDNKLFISYYFDYDTTQVYNLNGTEMPEFSCNLYSDCSGRVYSYGSEYLICSNDEVKSFFIPENPPEYIEANCHIGRFDFVNDVEIIQSGTEDYLYIFDQCYTEVYQIESTNNNEDLITESTQIIPYPNPFSFADTQNISFLPAGDCRNLNSETKLSIYNIKGQLLHNEYFQPGRNDITWDCQQKNGNKTPLGIYLYKIESDSYTDFGKFIIAK
ncbi:MAG: T9SS type A sorting domain-containing protein [Candidatus Cloacimonetes bacterium]|nr:T9SS type A sorting domain-containing protein [Candidatus Cloacimonadota bacterium]